MKPLDYIQSELEHCAEYALTVEDQKMLDKEGTEAFIYAKLTSKKFRKWAVDESSEKQAKRAIQLNVSQNKPLQFRYPFGGYKLWRMPGYPEVDWAEFFAIAYYCKFLAPIAAAYKPGLELLFGSDDLIIERMDNIPPADTDAYFNSFKRLLEAFQKHLPENFKTDIVRIGDLYGNKGELEQELAAHVTRIKQVYTDGGVEEAKKQKMLTTSELNIRWDGAKDLTKLSDIEKQAIINMGPVYHDAQCALSRRHEFHRGDEKIVIFTTPVPNAIAIGTTKNSMTKFWTGFGILEHTGDGFRPRVVSPKQLEALEGKPFESIPIKLIGLKNFEALRVY